MTTSNGSKSGWTKKKKAEFLNKAKRIAYKYLKQAGLAHYEVYVSLEPKSYFGNEAIAAQAEIMPPDSADIIISEEIEEILEERGWSLEFIIGHEVAHIVINNIMAFNSKHMINVLKLKEKDAKTANYGFHCITESLANVIGVIFAENK